MNKSSLPVIAIDGPSASGKGTVAQLVAKSLGFHYLDSGALYRIVALACQQRNISWDDAQAVADCAKTLAIRFEGESVYLNDGDAARDISEEIRTENIGKGASIVAVHPPLRAVLLGLQRDFLKAPGLVGDGRDMGTVIFPAAPLKIFLTAKTETRALRRTKQLTNKNQPANYDAILQDLLERDARDQNRASAPLVMAEDAILLETDHLDIPTAVDTILQQFRHKIAK